MTAEEQGRADVSFSSSWGVPSRLDNHYALRRYRTLLETISRIGETVAIFLCASLLVWSYVLVFHTNFENVLIKDGSDLFCGYDGDREEVFWINPLEYH